jgi:hypothetical protein
MKPKRKMLARLGAVLGRDRVRYLANHLAPRDLRALVDAHELAALRDRQRRQAEAADRPGGECAAPTAGRCAEGTR